MKIFFGSVFIDEEKLREVGIDYPVKVEYYKEVNRDSSSDGGDIKFGVKVVKTEYRPNNVVIENRDVKCFTNDEVRIDRLLRVLKAGEVTPVCVDDVIEDFCKEMF